MPQKWPTRSPGTNLQAVIGSQNTPLIPDTRIVLVFSNRKGTYGLTRASEATPPITTTYLALKPFLKEIPGKMRGDYDTAAVKTVLQAAPDLVVLAGWLHIFGDAFLDIMNGVVPVEGTERVPPCRAPLTVWTLSSVHTRRFRKGRSRIRGDGAPRG